MFTKCRACLGASDSMRHLSNDEPEGKRLISMFVSVVDFEWVGDNKIPSYLCGECEASLQVSYHFRKQCQESNEVIQRCLLEADTKDFAVDGFSEANSATEESEDEKPDVVAATAMRVKQVSAQEIEEAIRKYKERQSGEAKCIECGFVLSSIRSLAIHMAQSHKSVRGKWCFICNDVFEDMVEHRRVHESALEICQFCDKRVKRRYFVDHLRIHSGVRPFACRICRRGFLTPSALRFHYKMHGSTYRCDVCKAKFATESRLERHDCRIKEEDSSDSMNMAVVMHNFCKECDKKVRSLTSHMHKFHGKDEEKTKDDVGPPDIYVCNICDRQYKKKHSLQLHIRIHTGDVPHKCSYCGKLTRSKTQLVDHERTHTGEKPYICSVCGKGFAQSSALGTHMKQHTGRPEVCKICQKRFCRPSELKLHLMKHAGEKPYLCTACGRAFSQKSHLTEHTKTHSSQRPYKCDHCDKAFKTKSLLTSHMHIHLGYKRFKCSVCSYACFKPYRLAQHMKQHSGEVKAQRKEHVCKVCERGFTTQTLLNSHMSSSHNAIL